MSACCALNAMFSALHDWLLAGSVAGYLPVNGVRHWSSGLVCMA